LDIEKRVWIVARLAEIGRQLDEVYDSKLSREEQRKFAGALRAERKQLRRELFPDTDGISSCLQQT
jgi:hypothetical protein